MRADIVLTKSGESFTDITKGMANRLDSIVKKACLEIAKGAIREIQTGAKTGRVYNVKKWKSGVQRGSSSKMKGAGGGVYKMTMKKSAHQASAPGEAPATDTGHLVNAVTPYKRIGPRIGEIVFHSEYAKVLEFGGRHMEARPYLGPSMKKVRPKFMLATLKVIRRQKTVSSGW